MDRHLPKFLTALKQRRTAAAIVAFVVLAIILIALAQAALGAPVNRWGDGSTYYMQVLSIVNDHDIQYTQSDIQRIMWNPLDDVPSGMFLIKTAGGRYFYGKDFTFALFASPFFAFIGNNGILLFNALMLFGMILMGYLYLKKENGILAIAYSAIFFLLSIAYVYMYWMNPEVYDAFLIMLGLFIWLVYVQKSDVRFLAMASLALGLAAVAKTPDAVVFVPLAIYELCKRRYTNLLIAAGAFIIVPIVFYGYFFIQSGALSFYGGDRLCYVGNYPFWNGYNNTNEAGSQAFSINAANTLSALIDFNNLKIIPYNLFYYFFGRFTGMLWYYPFTIFALVCFLLDCLDVGYMKEHPEKLCILGAIVLYIFTYAVVIGDNYLGGGWAVGNRYFYIYPAFIFLMGRISPKKILLFIAFLALALITVMPLVSDPIGVSDNPYWHTTKSPYSSFPLEFSQLGNLPMWGTGYQDCYNNTFTAYQAPLGLYDGSLMVTNSDVILLSSKPIQRLDLSLYSDFNYHDGKVTTNGFQEDVPLGGMDTRRITITGMNPVYSDPYHYVYEIKVSLT